MTTIRGDSITTLPASGTTASAYASGNNGQIVTTNNGGFSWNLVVCPLCSRPTLLEDVRWLNCPGAPRAALRRARATFRRSPPSRTTTRRGGLAATWLSPAVRSPATAARCPPPPRYSSRSHTEPLAALLADPTVGTCTSTACAVTSAYTFLMSKDPMGCEPHTPHCKLHCACFSLAPRTLTRRPVCRMTGWAAVPLAYLPSSFAATYTYTAYTVTSGSDSYSASLGLNGFPSTLPDVYGIVWCAPAGTFTCRSRRPLDVHPRRAAGTTTSTAGCTARASCWRASPPPTYRCSRLGPSRSAAAAPHRSPRRRPRTEAPPGTPRRRTRSWSTAAVPAAW